MVQSNSILEAVKAFVETCPFLSDIELHIDQTDEEAESYAVTTAGLVKQSEDILGNQTWLYNAVLQSREYTVDDMSRLKASAFTEKFTFWIEGQNKARNYPELPDGMKAERITADNGMLLYIDDDGNRGIYQVQMHLLFKIEEEL